MTPTIRPFCLHDADRMAILWHASWRSTGVQASTQSTAADLRQRIDQELSAGWEVFVAEYEGALLGFMALKPAHHCLDQLFIAPHAKMRGIGKNLFSHAKTAMPKGFWLRAAAHNKEAKAFYEAVGMRLDRIEPHPRHGHETAVYVIDNHIQLGTAARQGWVTVGLSYLQSSSMGHMTPRRRSNRDSYRTQ